MSSIVCSQSEFDCRFIWYCNRNQQQNVRGRVLFSDLVGFPASYPKASSQAFPDGGFGIPQGVRSTGVTARPSLVVHTHTYTLG